MNKFSIALLPYLFFAVTAKAQYQWLNEEPYKSCMAWSEAQKELYKKAEPDVLAIRPLSDPVHDPTPDKYDYYGWPVGFQVGNVTIVNGDRRRYHWGSEEDNNGKSRSNAYIKRSLDGGKSWSAGVAVDKEEGFEENNRIGFGHALGYANGKVFLVSKSGVYVSTDTAKSWSRIAGSLVTPKRCPKGCKFNIGPRVLYHPEAGLMVFAQHGGKTMYDSLIVLNSLDEGKSWQVTSVPTHNPNVKPVEPTGFLLEDNRVIVFGRNGPNHTTNSPFSLELLVDGPGKYKVQHAVETHIPRGSHPDTHDIILNPFNNRFEAVISCRIPSDTKMKLTLWGIPKDELLAGNSRWRYEGTLIESAESYGPAPVGRFSGRGGYGDGQDGFHPAASVMLPDKNKQIIFVYMGKSTDTYASTFVIERTLDTEKLKQYLSKHQQ